MHELSVMTQLLDDAMAAANGQTVCALRVRVGPLSGVVTDALRFAFEALTPGTLVDGARLDIEETKPVFRCSRCETAFDPLPGSFACPGCGSFDGELVGGNELDLVSIEVPDHV